MSAQVPLRRPEAIVERSFAIAGEEASLDQVPMDVRAVALRLVHACGDPDVVKGLRWSSGAGAAGRASLRAGAPILVDSRMAADGVIRRRLLQGNDVLCTLALGQVAGLAVRRGITRSAAAVLLWQPWLEDALVAIGNAPTALFQLLEEVTDGGPRPALVIGMPVGAVGAAEAKDALAMSDLPHITLSGRRGGSALAAAAVNALSGETP